ncbi:MAG: LamG-like jellyroll fold domain-containing protein [Sedimentisphaerales bacterium]
MKSSTEQTLVSTDFAGLPSRSNAAAIDGNDFYKAWDDFENRFYLPQDSNLVDGGNVSDVNMWGYTTDPNAINDPNILWQDDNRRDIGYHYPMQIDTDDDGLYDYEEYWLGTAPDDNDSDNDGMDDGWEVEYGLNPLVDDADLDKDGDGMPNGWEYTYGFNPTINDSGNDADSDYYKNLSEYLHGSNPVDSNSVPTTITTIYVPEDAPTIQLAIDCSINGDVIVVSPGTYHENLNFNGQAITLTGTDPNNWTTVGMATISANDINVAVISFNQAEDSNSIIAGVKISGGLHGIECNDTSPVISNCIIAENGQTTSSGGGIYNINSATPLITNCFVVSNKAGDGGGIYNMNSNAIIRNCVISQNTAYGNGGGLYNVNCSPGITGCTITDNMAVNGGGVGSDSSSPEIVNCILWGNDASSNGDQVYNINSAAPAFEYSDIENCLDGNDWDSALGYDNGGNIDSDPCFVIAPEPDIANIVAYWMLDEGSGTTAFDAVGTNNGTVSGGMWAVGKINGGLSGNGVNGSVLVPDNIVLTPSSTMTLSFWVYRYDSSQTLGIYKYACCPSEPASPGNSRAYTLEVFGSLPKVRFMVFQAAGTYDYVDSIGTLYDNQWHLVTATFNSGIAEIYIDGVLDNSETMAVSAIMNDVQPLIIGGLWNFCGTDAWLQRLNGIVDEVMICNRTLSAEEISELYLYGLLGQYRYQIDTNSPCVNAGDPSGSYDGNDIDNEQRINLCRIDIGADEVNIPETLDSDGDGLINSEECENGTDPFDVDSDDDGMSDGWEVQYGLSPTNANDANSSLDSDEYSNICEFIHGSDPNDSNSLPQNMTINVPSIVEKIQDAIDWSIDGDTIMVSPGTYYESISFNDKLITLTSTDSNDWDVVKSTIIDANGLGNVIVFNAGDANSTLEGFTVQGASYYGVICSTSTTVVPTIQKCIIQNNNYRGIYCVGIGAKPIITNNIITDNNSVGIFCNLYSAPVIKNNFIYGHKYGIITAMAGSVIIRNNTIVNNTSGGVRKAIGTEPTISNCIIWDCNDDLYNCTATYSCIQDGDAGTGNISNDPCFIDIDANDFHLKMGSPCISAGDPNFNSDTDETDIDLQPRVQARRVDIGADEAVVKIYNINRNKHYGYIQSAIEDACNLDVIEVGTGIYNENINFLGKEITLQSTNPYDWDVVAATAIDANDSDLATVSFTNSEDSNSVIAGFKITGGLHGIECNETFPVITNCLITQNGNINTNGGGIYDCNLAWPLITNCFIVGNDANNGSGIYNYNSDAFVENCVISQNFANNNGGGIYNKQYLHTCNPVITNCTITDNDANNGGGMYNDYASYPDVMNCIFWNNIGVANGNEVYNVSGGLSYFANCDIQDSGGSSNWDNTIGSEQYPYGNIDSDPYFMVSEEPNAVSQYLYRIDTNSPCLNAGDMIEDYNDQFDIHNHWRRQGGRVDIGAYEVEYELTFPYTTSFEVCQDYNTASVESNTGWNVHAGNVSVGNASYHETEAVSYPYQYAEFDANTILAARFKNDPNNNSYLRISCIPSKNSYINLLNDGDIVASIHFGDSNTISVFDNGSYVNTSTGYQHIADKCRSFLVNTDPNMQDYSYENTWVEIKVHFDWENQTYDVFWSNWANVQGSYIRTNAAFNKTYDTYTEIQYVTGTEDVNHFYLNRISATDEPNTGGVFGDGNDVWITAPVADYENPLEGRCEITGSVWYDKLAEYRIECCQIDLNSTEPNNWILADSSDQPGRNCRIGYWNTASLMNGDYYLRLIVRDDLGRQYCGGFITKEVSYNHQAHDVNAVYSVIGRNKGQIFTCQETAPDIKVNWPGSFPFEFTRIYSHGLRKQFYPLFFGWTHNNNIKMIENCTSDWAKDLNGNPAADGKKLGFGRLWLMLPTGGNAFKGQLDVNDPNKVIYKTLDGEPDYVIRTSAINIGTQTFDVNYTYYAHDGMKMIFGKSGNKLQYYPSPANEGVVDWCVFLGIDRQEDRFGNALIYEWGNIGDVPVFVKKISNNRTPAAMIFDCNGVWGTYDRIRLSNGSSTTDTMVSIDGYSVVISGNYNDDFMYAGYETFWPSDWDAYSYHYTYNDDDVILDEMNGDQGLVDVTLSYYDDGSLHYRNDTSGWGDYQYCAKICCQRKYRYEFSDSGHLITHEEFHIVKYDFMDIPISDILYKEIDTEKNSNGSILKQTTEVKNTGLDPESDYSSGNSDNDSLNFVGGGGYTDTSYSYENPSFSTKPTTILEYFDDDGDGHVGGMNDRPYRKTTFVYDPCGNMTEQRVYVNDSQYVLTQYSYHSIYNFPTRKTTWKSYASGESIPSVGKVEQQWIYGNADGSVNPQGNYLTQEKTLLDDKDTSNEADDIWAVTYYVYEAGGQVKKITDPEQRITFYNYDSSGFIQKVWQGATLVNGNPIGNPQERYCYDPNSGILLLEADYKGLVKLYVYNTCYKRMETRIYFDSTAMSRPDFNPASYESIDFSRKTIHVEYDRAGNCVKQKDCTGSYVFKEVWYDGKTIFAVDNDSYGDSGNFYRGLLTNGLPLLERTMARENGGNYKWIETRYYRDSMERVVSKSEFDWSNPIENSASFGRYTEYTYTGSGAKSSEKVYHLHNYSRYDHEIGDIEKEIHYFYDFLDRLTEQVVTLDSVNQITKFGYDAVGNQLYIIDPNGNVLLADYDNANRKTAEYFAINPLPNAQDFSYQSTLASAKVRQRTEYYNDNKVKAITSYDQEGTAILAKTGYSYDACGRISDVNQSIDSQPANNAITVYDYNDTHFGDPNFAQLSITDANGHTTYISQNEDGKITKILYPSGDFEETFYDANGIAVSKTVWQNQIQYLNYEYDKYGRRTRTVYPDGGYLEFEYTHPIYLILGQYNKITKITDARLTGARPTDSNGIYLFTINFVTGDTLDYKVYEQNNNILQYSIYYDYLAAYPDCKKGVQVFNSNDVAIYDVNYAYDLAGRLVTVKDELADSNIASFDYDLNGNRVQLKYWLTGEIDDANTVINYAYDIQNNLIGIVSKSPSGEPNYTFDADTAGNIDGLGRLIHAAENISLPGAANKNHTLNYAYDMQSCLVDANITNINGGNWTAGYSYKKDGNIETKDVNSQQTTYQYDGDLMTDAGNDELDWDENGRLVATPTIDFEYNWDGKLRSAVIGANSVNIKYDPMGNRVFKNSSTQGTRKYIVDIVGGLPTILCEIDPCESDPNCSLKKVYYYANAQILKQDNSGGSYYYVHDRLGSVRLVVNDAGDVNNTYTYNPFGEDLPSDCNVTVYNPFKFTGQWFDSEIGQYYLRARMYDPALMRFTGRDPVKGAFKSPMSLHRYLYCENEPIDRTDPTGRLFGIGIGAKIEAASATVAVGIRAGAANFVNAINVMNTWTSMQMDKALSYGDDCYWAATRAMAVGQGMLSTAARGGVGEMKIFGSFLREAGIVIANGALKYANARPEGALELVGTVLGDPNPSQTIDGMITDTILKGYEKATGNDVDDIRNEIKDWFQ